MQSNSRNYKIGQKNFPDKNFQERRSYFCDHCKIPGHSTQRCFKLHGYPPGHRLHKGRRVAAVAQAETATDSSYSQTPALTTEQYNQLIQSLQQHSTDMNKSNETGSVAGFFAGKSFCFLSKSTNNSVWVVDSGASDHVTYDLSLLHNVKKLNVPWFITMPNGKRATITHSGSMVLGDILELHNVLYIPTFQYNLLSVSKLVNQFSANVIFTPHSCVLQAPTIQKELLLGKEHKGLFLLEKGCSSASYLRST